MSRRLLHHSKLNEFKEWLTRQGIEYREGKGDNQVLQVYEKGNWLGIYERSEITPQCEVKIKTHLTNDRRLDRIVSKFCKDLQFQKTMTAVITFDQLLTRIK